MKRVVRLRGAVGFGVSRGDGWEFWVVNVVRLNQSGLCAHGALVEVGRDALVHRRDHDAQAEGNRGA